MLSNSKLVAFIATSRPDDSKRFYEQSLGLSLVSNDDYAIVFDGGGVMLRVQKVTGHIPPPYTVLGWDVADIRSSVSKLSVRGIECERYTELDQDALGIWLSPGGALVAWIKDPDGNTISLTQYK